MFNMFNLNIKIYIILLTILGILVVAVILFSSQKKQPVTISQLEINPTPTRFIPLSTISPTKIVITPRFTGANVNIPSSLLNAAKQKQALKKKTPLTENGFVVTYDYQSDLFIVTLSDPKETNRSIFEQWLKQNYSLIPISKFVLK